MQRFKTFTGLKTLKTKNKEVAQDFIPGPV
jgi:hypothetical protein